MNLKKELIKNDAFIIEDLLAGDMSTFDLDILKNFDFKKINAALDYIKNNEQISDSKKVNLLEETWRINYRDKPPSIEEFLTPKYLGEVGEALYPHVKNTIIEFFNPANCYRNLILYPHISWGKSFCSSIIQIYIGIHLAMMRSAHKFLGLNVATPLTQLLVSYTQTKTSELLLEPMMNMLGASPFFEKVHRQEAMIKKDREFINSGKVEKIYWTTATTNGTSDLQFSNGSNFKIVSQVQGLLGLSVVSGVLSELSFFTLAGKSDEYIMRVFNDLKYRITSRMRGNYFGRTILDSSPNTLESPIDRYIINDAPKDPLNYIVSGSRWKWFPEEFVGAKYFPVYVGGKGQPPKIIDDISAAAYSPTDIIQVPDAMNLKQVFTDDIYKALKDWAGIPSGNADKVFPDDEKINKIFNENIKNLYLPIQARADEEPKELIWKQIKSEFFILINNKHQFWYKPWLERFVSVDQSISGDITGIAISHGERSDGGDLIVVVDMTVPISPKGSRINLDAIKNFIEDLRNIGGMNIKHISFDNFQSESSKQYLKRMGFEVDDISVDKTLDPYYNMISLIESGRLKCGKNILLKNNLRSISVTKRDSGTPKVDHTPGDIIYDGDANWDTSIIGYNAKDISDAVCGTIELIRRYGQSFLYEKYNEEDFKPKNFEIIEKDLTSLMSKLGLSVY